MKVISDSTEHLLILELGEYHANEIAKRVVKWLQILKGNCLLSGDDSGLEATWDEICVQVQDEPSHFWDIYVGTPARNSR